MNSAMTEGNEGVRSFWMRPFVLGIGGVTVAERGLQSDSGLLKMEALP